MKRLVPYHSYATGLRLACCILLIGTFFRSDVYSQNLETIGKEKPIKLSGGVSLSQIGYAASGIDSRRDPYSYYATGNLNVSLYGWSIPLSFSYSNQGVSFQQPFNQFSMHPTYKWITLHAGFTSMNFSPYTVGGHLFSGVGVDANPTSKLRISALYGRFLKAVQPDTAAGSRVQAAYDRYGYGMKVGYGDGKDFVEAIVFRAQDEQQSIRFVPETQGILPQENLVLGFTGGKSLFQKLLLRFEWATSAITRDTRAGQTTTENPLGNVGGLFTPRTSSSYYNAMKANVTYQGNGYSVGMGYERIDPQYRTLGSYFFNNDLENITVNAATALLQGKVNLSANVGTQRDNLDESKATTMRRVVTALNVAFAPSQKFNLSVSYSSFQSFTNVRSQFVDINRLTQFDFLDTLNFTQISQNANINSMYQLGNNKNRRQTISLNLTAQGASDKQGQVEQNSGLRFYNFNSSYSLSLTPQSLTLSTSFNLSMSDGVASQSRTFGPTVAVTKQFFEKKLRTTASISHNESYANGLHTGSILNGRLSGNVSIKKKHNVNLSTVVVNRNSVQEGAAKSFTEFTATLGYVYSF
ncbi:MAG: hypothetical protein ACK5RG_07645 [Cyclobacteriaceae bacterium]|jgi:hypothetical protein|nr:hypothetical protein [Flammeovirgaceae bacterium]